jgi:oxalate decarboxylase/phosphoglucose isomerase-like protein (cupin superfamily)
MNKTSKLPKQAPPDPRIIQRVNIDTNRKPDRRLRLLNGNVYLYPGTTRMPSSFAAVEHFAPGETVYWCFMGDEWQYVLKGEADITYSLAATMHTEEREIHVGPGDLYAIPAGARLRWTVTSKEPFMHLCVVVLLSAPRSEELYHVAPGALEYL